MGVTMNVVTVTLCVALLCIVATASPHAHAPFRGNAPIIPCATDEVFEMRQGKLSAQASCTTRGQCDDPAHRDKYGGENTVITIKTAVHVMRSSLGKAPDGVTDNQVTKMMERMNTAFGSYGIQFYYHENSSYYCIPAYSGANSDWLDAIDSMKETYAIDVGSAMNIFISCQTPSFQGTLFGIGTFPWDSAALTATGGLWLNSISVNDTARLEGDITAEHETGHCLGLWHTFHGTDEVLGCGLACEEYPHGDFDHQANLVGDFCSDTPATPRNYNCKDPIGNACDGTPWGDTDYTNYMGYGMDPQPCGNHFTTQQKDRMHCWLCEALPGWLSAGSCPSP